MQMWHFLFCPIFFFVFSSIGNSIFPILYIFLERGWGEAAVYFFQFVPSWDSMARPCDINQRGKENSLFLLQLVGKEICVFDT
jgi:hypothetical protein